MSTTKNQNPSRTVSASATAASIASVAANALPPIVPIKYNEAIIDTIRSPINNRLTPIESGSEVEKGVLVFEGRATANKQIIIFDNGVEIARVNATASGKWVWSSDAFTSGEHHFTVQVAGAGNPVSENYAISIPSQPEQPEQPVLVERAIDDSAGYYREFQSGGNINDTTPRFSGTAAPRSVVKIYDNEREIGSVLTNAQGQWSFEADLANGAHSLVFVAGESSSAPFILNVTSPQSQPIEIGYVYDDSNPNFYQLLNPGDTTTDSTPRFFGKAGISVVIRVFNDGQEIGSVLSDTWGYWSLAPSLSAGQNSLVFKAGEGSETKPYVLNIATADTQPVEIWGALEDSYGYNRDLSAGATIKDTTPYFHGKAGANVVVRLYNGDKEIGSTLADAYGRWSLTPTLTSGSYNLIFKAGEGSATKPFPVTIISAAAEPVEVYGVYQDINGWNERIFGGSTEDTSPRFAGTSGANVVVYLYNGAQLIGSAKADSRGSWSLTPELPYGSYNFVFKTAEGSASAPVALTIAPPAPVAPQAPIIEYILDDVGIGGYLRKNATTDDDTPKLFGTAEPNSLVEIFDNGVKIGERRVSATGYWDFTPVKPAYLENGLHSLVAKSSNGSESEAWNIAVKVPVSVNFVGSNSGEFTGDHETADSTPFITGYGPKGVLIRLYEDGKEIGSVITSKSNGSWTIDITDALSAGAHSVVAKFGNDNVSTQFDFVITAPEVIAPRVLEGVSEYDGIEHFGNGAEIYDNTPLLHGLANAGATVFISIDGNVVGSAIANELGRWSFQTQEPLSAGNHHVVAMDAAGNQGGALNFNLVDPQEFNIKFHVYNDQAGEAAIGHGEVTNDATPLLRGLAGQNILLDIYDNGAKIGSVQTAQDGSWSFQLDLANGAHSITVKSDYQESFLLRQFTVAADTVTIDSITGRYADYDNTQPSGGDPINDNSIVLYGTAAPDATVQLLTIDGRSLGYTGATLEGRWYLEVDSRFEDGNYSVIARVNGVDSEVFTFQIGEPAPATKNEQIDLFDIFGAELLSEAQETLLGKEVEAEAQPVNLNLSQADLAVVTTSGIATSTVAVATLQEEQYQAI